MDLEAIPDSAFVNADWIRSYEGAPRQRAEIVSNIARNSSLGLLPFVEEDNRDGILVICGGSPSLANDIGLVKALWERGARVMAINDAHVYLSEQGIKPHGWVYTECLELPENHRWYRQHSMTDLYVASHANTNSVIRLKDENTVIWHWYHFPLANEVIGTFYPGQPVFGGGCGGLTRLINAGIMGWGFRNIHVFGCDSSFPEGQSHAYRVDGQPNPTHHDLNARPQPVECLGRRFLSTATYIRQARDFCNLMTQYAQPFPELQVSVYGNGLLSWLVTHLGEYRNAA